MKTRHVYCASLVLIVLFAALFAYYMACFQYGLVDSIVPVDNAIEDEIGIPGLSNTTFYIPHIVRFNDRGVAYYDGNQHVVIDRYNGNTVKISGAREIYRDISLSHGQYHVIAFDSHIKMLSGPQLGTIVSFSIAPEEQVYTGVFDAARDRVFTLGRDKGQSTNEKLINGVLSESTALRAREMSGRVLGKPYYFSDACRVLARDRYCDTIVVGSVGGEVHLFRTNEAGYEPVLHRNYGFMGGVTEVSCAEGVVAVTLEGGVRIFKAGVESVDADFTYPVETPESVDSGWPQLQLRSTVANEQWAAYSCENTLYCVDVNKMLSVRSIDFSRKINGICSVSVDRHNVAVLLDTSTQRDSSKECPLCLVDLSTGKVDNEYFDTFFAQ